MLSLINMWLIGRNYHSLSDSSCQKVAIVTEFQMGFMSSWFPLLVSLSDFFFLYSYYLCFFFSSCQSYVLWIVQSRACSPLSSHQWYIFSIWLFVDFSILRRILHPIGNITSPYAPFSGNNIFCLDYCFCSLEFLYFILKCKYLVFYLGVSPEINRILNLVIL